MKISYVLLLAALLSLPACEQKSTNVNQQDGIKDALDARPHEELRDAADDVKEAAEDLGSDVKDAAKDVGSDLKDAVKE